MRKADKLVTVTASDENLASSSVDFTHRVKSYLLNPQCWKTPANFIVFHICHFYTVLLRKSLHFKETERSLDGTYLDLSCLETQNKRTQAREKDEKTLNSFFISKKKKKQNSKIELSFGKELTEVAMTQVCGIINEELNGENCSLFLIIQEIGDKNGLTS